MLPLFQQKHKKLGDRERILENTLKNVPLTFNSLQTIIDHDLRPVY